MEQGIVIYTTRSGHGSVKRYAEAIGAACNFDVRDAEKTHISKLQNYHTIIYGGGLYHDKINGIRYLMDNIGYFPDQNIIVFGVGISPVDARLIEAVTLRSFGKDPQRIPYLVCLRGSFDPSAARGGLFANRLHKDLVALQAKADAGGGLTPGEKDILEAWHNNTALNYENLDGIGQITAAVKLFARDE